MSIASILSSGHRARASKDYRQSHQSAETASSYDREFQDPATPSGVLWQLEQQILGDLLPKIAGQAHRALDFACGTGRILSLVSKHVPSTTGLDIAPEMLKLAAERCPSSQLIAGDITADPKLVSGPFDLITAFRFFLLSQPTLRHEVLAKLRPLLAPSGYFVANFHRNPTSIHGVHAKVRTALTGKPLPAMSIRDASQLLAAHGLAVEQIIGYRHLFYRGAPRGSAAIRRWVDGQLWTIPWLKVLGSSFIIVARPTP